MVKSKIEVAAGSHAQPPVAEARPRPSPSPLLEAHWLHVAPTALDDFRASDWALLDAQRAPFQAAQQASQVLRMLAVSRDDPSFGYGVNNYRHCLQSATLALRDGLDEENAA